MDDEALQHFSMKDKENYVKLHSKEYKAKVIRVPHLYQINGM